MFGRKKQPQVRSAGRPVRLDPQKMMRVWAAFVNDPNPPPDGFGGPAPAPPPPVGAFGGAAPTPPPPIGGGPAAGSGFVFNITPFSGSEAGMANAGAGSLPAGGVVDLPGVGPVDLRRVQAATERLEALVREVMGADAGGLDGMEAWGPQQAGAALERLPGLLAQGRINTEQFEAIKDLLDSVAAKG